MEMIPFEQYVKQHMEHNPSDNEARYRKKLRKYVNLRDNGARCEVCGNQPIAAGLSSACDWRGCFPCITGEHDDSDDYEPQS